MKRRMGFGLMVLAAFAVAAPGRVRTNTITMDIVHPMTIAGTTLPPGSYEFHVKAGDNQVEILKNDNLVARVQGEWVELDSKAEQSQILSTNNVIQEIDVQGDREALRFKD
jgi:hypothetical protein